MWTTLLRFLLSTFLLSSLSLPSTHAVTVSFNTTEKQPVGTIIGSLAESTWLSALYSAAQLSSLEFIVLSDPPQYASQFISVQNQTGVLQIKTPINRDVICPSLSTCTLVFDVALSPPQYFQIISAQITVTDLNDFVPTFPVNTTTLAVLESVAAGTLFQLPWAVDQDSPAYGTLSYSLAPLGSPFTLHWTQKSLQLVVSGVLDREAVSQYALTVIATGSGPQPLSGTMRVSVIVLDANDVTPVFTQASYAADVWEDAAAETSLITVHAVDYDLGDNGEVHYEISGVVATGASVAAQQNLNSLFVINEVNGTISLERSDLDREVVSAYILTVVAVDGGVPSLTSTVSVTINVLDVNDRAPRISVDTLTSVGSTAQVLEHSPVGTFAALVTATDADVGPNANVSCQLDPISTAFGLVYIQYERYKLVTLISLDWETQAEYNVTIVCSDQGWTQLASTAILTVQVLDINDNAPIFTAFNYSATMLDDVTPGAYVTNVTAVDKDSGENGRVTYALFGDWTAYFSVDVNLGLVSTRASFNREMIGQYELVIIASDHGQPARSANATVLVSVIDVNDVTPKFTWSTYTFFMRDNYPADQLVGAVSAFAVSKEYGSFAYSLLSDSIPSDISATKAFAIDSNTGLLTTTKVLIREQQDVYRFLVNAKNDRFQQSSASASVVVYVADFLGRVIVVDYPSWGNSTVGVSSQLLRGQVVTQIKAREVNGTGHNLLNYNIQSSQGNVFTINSATGVIYASQDLIEFIDEGFQLTINVSNIAVPPLWTLAYLTINISASISSPYAAQSLPSNPNIVVVACLSAASCVVVLILLAAIAYVIHRARVRRRQRIREGQKSLADDVMSCVVSPLEWIRGVEAMEAGPAGEGGVRSASSGCMGGGRGGRRGERRPAGVAVSSSSRSGRYSVAVAGMARASSQLSSKGSPGTGLEAAKGPPAPLRGTTTPGEQDSATSSDSGRGQSPLYAEQFSHGADILDDTPFSYKNLPRLSSSPHNSNYVLHPHNSFSKRNPPPSRSSLYREVPPGPLPPSHIDRSQELDWSPADVYIKSDSAAQKQKIVQLSRSGFKDRDLVQSPDSRNICDESEAYSPQSDTSLVSLDTAALMGGYRASSEVSDEGTSVTSGSYVIHHSMGDFDAADVVSLSGSLSFSVV